MKMLSDFINYPISKQFFAETAQTRVSVAITFSHTERFTWSPNMSISRPQKKYSKDMKNVCAAQSLPFHQDAIEYFWTKLKNCP